MIRRLQEYFGGVKAVTIDGWLYVVIAWCSAWSAVFSTDEAAKYLPPDILFWLRAGFGTSGASALALKMFRSTQYADHQEQKKRETTFLGKPGGPAGTP